MRSIYDRACSYAYTLFRGEYSHNTYYKELVHNAWLVHYEAHNKDLFERPFPYVLKAIKYRFHSCLYKEIFYWRQEKHNKTYIKFDEIFGDEVSKLAQDSRLSNSETPFDQASLSQFQEILSTSLSNYRSGRGRPAKVETMQKYLELLQQGYTNPEIAKKLRITENNCKHFKTKIKSIINSMEQFNSPFNGNKLTIPKKNKITRKHYEENKEKYADYIWDTDRWSDSNEFYEQKTHKDKLEGLLIVEGNKLDQ